MEQFKNWHEIKEWAEKNGYKNMAARMQLNNDAWMSSGEFGRNQVEICDAMRSASTEEERHEIAKQIDEATKENYGLW
jgi:hypothetical protein